MQVYVESLFVSLKYRVIHVFRVADEHIAWGVRDREGRFALHEHRLRRYSAGPEDRRLAVADLYRVAEVGLADVFDADRRCLLSS